jgi:hypothetical protein
MDDPSMRIETSPPHLLVDILLKAGEDVNGSGIRPGDTY